MPRVANFTSAGTPVDPTGGMTLDALMARQKLLAEQGRQIAAPRDMQSPWQGAAMLAQSFVNARQEAQAQAQETAGRDALAKIKAGINYETGATPAQISEMARYSPEDADRMTQMAVEAIRAKRAADAAIANREDQQAFQAGQQANQQQFSAGQTEKSQAFTAAQADKARVTYRPPTTEELRQFNIPVDPTTGQPSVPYKWNETTQTPEPIGTGSGQNINVMTGEVEARKKLAASLGLTENSPGYNAYVLTGNMPKEAQQSATDKKAIITADDLVVTNQQVVDQLSKVISGPAGQTLNDRAGYGGLAQTQAWAARNDPTGYFDDQKGQATTELNNIVTGTALASLRSIFGGNPTEGERAVLLDMQASVDKTPQERKAIIERAIELANNRLQVNKQRAQELRGGTYFEPGGGAAAAAPSAPAQPAPTSDLPEGVTEDDITATMAARKMTRQQVLDALAAKQRAP